MVASAFLLSSVVVLTAVWDTFYFVDADAAGAASLPCSAPGDENSLVVLPRVGSWIWNCSGSNASALGKGAPWLLFNLTTVEDANATVSLHVYSPVSQVVINVTGSLSPSVFVMFYAAMVENNTAAEQRRAFVPKNPSGAPYNGGYDSSIVVVMADTASASPGGDHGASIVITTYDSLWFDGNASSFVSVVQHSGLRSLVVVHSNKNSIDTSGGSGGNSTDCVLRNGARLLVWHAASPNDTSSSRIPSASVSVISYTNVDIQFTSTSTSFSDGANESSSLLDFSRVAVTPATAVDLRGGARASLVGAPSNRTTATTTTTTTDDQGRTTAALILANVCNSVALYLDNVTLLLMGTGAAAIYCSHGANATTVWASDANVTIQETLPLFFSAGGAAPTTVPYPRSTAAILRVDGDATDTELMFVASGNASILSSSAFTTPTSQPSAAFLVVSGVAALTYAHVSQSHVEVDGPSSAFAFLNAPVGGNEVRFEGNTTTIAARNRSACVTFVWPYDLARVYLGEGVAVSLISSRFFQLGCTTNSTSQCVFDAVGAAISLTQHDEPTLQRAAIVSASFNVVNLLLTWTKTNFSLFNDSSLLDMPDAVASVCTVQFRQCTMTAVCENGAAGCSQYQRGLLVAKLLIDLLFTWTGTVGLSEGNLTQGDDLTLSQVDILYCTGWTLSGMNFTLVNSTARISASRFAAVDIPGSVSGLYIYLSNGNYTFTDGSTFVHNYFTAFVSLTSCTLAVSGGFVTMDGSGRGNHAMWGRATNYVDAATLFTAGARVCLASGTQYLVCESGLRSDVTLLLEAGSALQLEPSSSFWTAVDVGFGDSAPRMNATILVKGSSALTLLDGSVLANYGSSISVPHFNFTLVSNSTMVAGPSGAILRTSACTGPCAIVIDDCVLWLQNETVAFLFYDNVTSQTYAGSAVQLQRVHFNGTAGAAAAAASPPYLVAVASTTEPLDLVQLPPAAAVTIRRSNLVLKDSIAIRASALFSGVALRLENTSLALHSSSGTASIPSSLVFTGLCVADSELWIRNCVVQAVGVAPWLIATTSSLSASPPTTTPVPTGFFVRVNLTFSNVRWLGANQSELVNTSAVFSRTSPRVVSVWGLFSSSIRAECSLFEYRPRLSSDDLSDLTLSPLALFMLGQVAIPLDVLFAAPLSALVPVAIFANGSSVAAGNWTPVFSTESQVHFVNNTFRCALPSASVGRAGAGTGTNVDTSSVPQASIVTLMSALPSVLLNGSSSGGRLCTGNLSVSLNECVLEGLTGPSVLHIVGPVAPMLQQLLTGRYEEEEYAGVLPRRFSIPTVNLRTCSANAYDTVLRNATAVAEWQSLMVAAVPPWSGINSCATTQDPWPLGAAPERFAPLRGPQVCPPRIRPLVTLAGARGCGWTITRSFPSASRSAALTVVRNHTKSVRGRTWSLTTTRVTQRVSESLRISRSWRLPTVSETASALPPQPPPPPTPVSRATQAVAVVSASTGAVVAASISAAGPLTSLSFIQTSTAAIRCAQQQQQQQQQAGTTGGDGNDAPGKFLADNPLRLYLPSVAGERAGYPIGAVLANSMIVWPVFTFVIVALTFVRMILATSSSSSSSLSHRGGFHREWTYQQNFVQLMTEAKMPGTFAVPYSVLLQPTMAAACGLLAMRSDDDAVGTTSAPPLHEGGTTNRIAIGVIGVLLSVAPLGWYVFRILVLRRPFPLESAPIGARRAQRRGVEQWRSRIARLWERATEASHEWRVRLSADALRSDPSTTRKQLRGFLRRYALLVEPYRGGYHAYFVIELGVPLVAAIPIGVAWGTGGASDCNASLWVLLGVTLLSLAGSLLRPYVTAFDNAWTILMNTLSVLVLLLLLLGDPDGASIVTLAQAVAAVLPVLRMIPVAWGSLQRWWNGIRGSQQGSESERGLGKRTHKRRGEERRQRANDPSNARQSSHQQQGRHQKYPEHLVGFLLDSASGEAVEEETSEEEELCEGFSDRGKRQRRAEYDISADSNSGEGQDPVTAWWDRVQLPSAHPAASAAISRKTRQLVARTHSQRLLAKLWQLSAQCETIPPTRDEVQSHLQLLFQYAEALHVDRNSVR